MPVGSRVRLEAGVEASVRGAPVMLLLLQATGDLRCSSMGRPSFQTKEMAGILVACARMCNLLVDFITTSSFENSLMPKVLTIEHTSRPG